MKQKRDKFISIHEENKLKDKIEALLLLQNNESDHWSENDDDFFYFYQASTGENLFLHPLCAKLFHMEHNKEFQKYPLRITSKIEEIEHDILDMESAHKRMKYLSYMPEMTPFALVELDMQKLVNEDKIIS